jgi:SH3 domain-containing YSC84-like protein 1
LAIRNSPIKYKLRAHERSRGDFKIARNPRRGMYAMRLKTGPLAVLTAAVLASTMAIAAEEPSEQVKRMDAAATVLDEIMGTPDKGIPEELLDSAKCVAVIPSMVKIGFVFGGRHGRGIATCRTATGWSAPAPFSVTGGSWGLQIGGEA